MPNHLIALLSETGRCGLDRLLKDYPAARLSGWLAALPDGRRVAIITPRTADRLRGLDISGFWVEGEVPDDLVALAVAQANPPIST